MRRNLTHFAESGRMFHDITELSARGIPTISVVFGSSTAGGAYQPGLADYNIFVRGGAKVFLGGPPLVKVATGEDSDDEELGGAQMHATVSGLADYLAEDEHDAIRDGPRRGGAPALAQAGPGPGHRGAGAAALRPRRTARADAAATCAPRSTPARSSRAWSTAAVSKSSRCVTDRRW